MAGNPSNRGLELSWKAERGGFYQVEHTLDPALGFSGMGGWIRAEETMERLALPAAGPGSPRGFFRVRRSFADPPEE